MDLRAFLINQIEPYNLRKVFYCLFVFCLTLSYSKANRQVQLPKIPYEIEFADVVFQLNDAARFLLREEVEKLESNAEIKQRQLEYLSLFLPEVNQVLKESVVPEDFKYLVIYNKHQLNTVQSEVLEQGVFWCINRQLALDLDLRVNSKIDERKNFFIATDGAVIGFRRNNVLYNNWGTTLFAQLASREVINLLGVNKNWNGKKYLVLDGLAYSSLIQFLAFKLVMESELPTYRPKEERVIYKYPYGRQKSLNVIAADLRIEPLEMQNMNLWLKEGQIPNEDIPLVVIVPSSRYNDVRILAEISSNAAFSKDELGFPVLNNDPSLSENRGGEFYRINGKKGIKADLCDSYVTLAYKGRMSIKNFLDYNEMTEQDVVSIGRIYYLEGKNNKGPIEKHISREGETLWDISMTYGVSLEELLKYNRLETVQKLQRGRVVYLQDKRPKDLPVEYVEFQDKLSLNETLYQDPILGKLSNFDWSPDIELEKDSKFLAIEDSVEEWIPLPVKEESDRKVVVVRPIERESFSTNLKNKVMGIETPKEDELPDYVVHTVRKGETLYRISVNYRVSVKQLYKLNGLRTDIIEIGDKIRVKPI